MQYQIGFRTKTRAIKLIRYCQGCSQERYELSENSKYTLKNLSL
jgi:hypothetical protein